MWTVVLISIILLSKGVITTQAFFEHQEYTLSEASDTTNLETALEIPKRYPLHLDPYVLGMGPKFWIASGECPKTADGGSEYFCPSPNSTGYWVCVDDYQLCDGIKHCPQAEDESSTHCLFFRIIRYQISLLAKGMDAIDSFGRVRTS